jgi:hypothetical protein
MLRVAFFIVMLIVTSLSVVMLNVVRLVVVVPIKKLRFKIFLNSATPTGHASKRCLDWPSSLLNRPVTLALRAYLDYLDTNRAYPYLR